jgi:hypothetical protein
LSIYDIWHILHVSLQMPLLSCSWVLLAVCQNKAEKQCILLACIIRAYCNVEQRYLTPLSLIKSTILLKWLNTFNRRWKSDCFLQIFSHTFDISLENDRTGKEMKKFKTFSSLVSTLSSSCTAAGQRKTGRRREITIRRYYCPATQLQVVFFWPLTTCMSLPEPNSVILKTVTGFFSVPLASCYQDVKSRKTNVWKSNWNSVSHDLVLIIAAQFISYTKHLKTKHKYNKVNTRKQTRSSKTASKAQPCVLFSGYVLAISDPSSVSSTFPNPAPWEKGIHINITRE